MKDLGIARFSPLLVLLAACTDGSGSGTEPPVSGAIAGNLLFVPAAALAARAPIAEVEPNDGADEPQWIGEIGADRACSIRGSIAAGEGFDGFAFVARQHVRVTAELRGAGASGRRPSLSAYDPVAMSVVAEAAATGRLEFDAAGPFDLVLHGAESAVGYELAVRAAPAAGSVTAPGWFGAVAVGDRRHGSASAGGRFEATAVEAARVRITARGEPGRTLRASRVSRDGEEPAASGSTGSRIEFDVDPLERFALDTEAGGAFELEVVERAGAPDLRPRRNRLQSAERERADFGLATGDILYGRAPTNAKLGEILVGVVGLDDITPALARRGLVRIGQVGEGTLQVAADLALVSDDATRARTTVALARSLRALPQVEYAELNRIRKPFGGTSAFLPNDEFFGLQWHYPLIHLPEAWGEVRTAITGPGGIVDVAVIDTGRRPHPDLDANTKTGIEFDFITDPAIADDGDGPDANAFDTGDSEGIGPSSFHGTHVAGTIAAVTQNGSGVAGVGSVPVGLPEQSRVNVVHLRVLGKGGGTDADIARAIRYAAGLSNPGLPALTAPLDVINLSLGGPGFNQTVQNEITAARNRGVTIFAAAGNENSGVPSYPAAYANVVSVAAVDQNSARAPYSNFHPTVDLCAPGGDTSVNTNPGTGPGQDEYVDGVLSTLVDGTTGGPNFVFYQGTSMACPHAAGLAALMLVVNPVLSPGEIETKLADTAIDLGTAGRDPYFGEGLVDALAAVRSAGTGGPSTPTLAVNPTVLNFGPQATELEIALSNIGGGSIDVTAITVDRPWVTLTNGGAGAGIDIGSYSVVVDRADPELALDGSYAATIAITTDAGGVSVPVTVVVETTVLPDVDLVVLAVDISGVEPVTVAGVIVNPALVGLEYVLDELSTGNGELLPPGQYLVVCGSDDDEDQYICGIGDTYCGFFPTLNDPSLVTVNGTVTGIDFVVAPLDLGPSLASFRGFSTTVR